jgi:hypothetical protein
MDETVDYCRQIESYLCQKNGGHLVRIVGPAFEKVRDWAGQGVPLKIAFRGIDRCCERAQARGARRRPLRIEFCEADVLEAFDDWRRALGITGRQVAESAGTAAEDDGAGLRKASLATHIQRCVTRLLAPRGLAPDAEYDALLRRATEELDELAVRAKSARGDARAEVIRRLSEVDAALVDAARGRIDERTVAALRAEAEAELAGFVNRMPADALAQARERAFERLLRDALNLPVLSYE